LPRGFGGGHRRWRIRDAAIDDRRLALLQGGWHSCAEPPATPEKLRRFGLVKPPLPSGMLVETDNAARLIWSVKKTFESKKPASS
jgi:hypothetical protein